jgi:hypothetical protein
MQFSGAADLAGFHPLDGARHLRTPGWAPAICNLVARHSGARFVARVLKLDRELDAYPFSQDAVSDALTVADQITGPHGEAMNPDERISDMLRRHGPHSANGRPIPCVSPPSAQPPRGWPSASKSRPSGQPYSCLVMAFIAFLSTELDAFRWRTGRRAGRGEVRPLVRRGRWN